MCGILGLFNVKGEKGKTRKLTAKLLKRLLHRGPDEHGIEHFESGYNRHHYLCHQRLQIVDPENGKQPFFGEKRKVCSVVNGEIYNHMELRKSLRGEHNFIGEPDCLIVPHLYQEYDIATVCNMLSGKFAGIIYDIDQDRWFIIRDHMGINPVYIGRGFNGEFFAASELKSFHDYASSIEILLPGHYYDSKLDQQIKWYNPIYRNPDLIPDTPVDLDKLRNLLVQSVKRRLMVDCPFGVLLSGGLDSSLIASITSRLYEEFQKKRFSDDFLITKKLSTFCIGLDGSPDLKASREVADFLGTKHHEFTFTVEEGIDAISEVIYHIETFNPTTIRAATPMYLMSRMIKSQSIKMLMTGEGSDEVFGGYLYFHKAPNKREFHQETIRKILDLYKYDLLRANKSTAAWGLEARVPFLDRDFVEYSMSFDPQDKMINTEHPIEKWVLRKAFDDKENPYLPERILWRQKEQFSDGVGYNWIDSLKAFIDTQVSDSDLNNAGLRFPIMTPPTKEAYYYRMIFEEHFPSMTAVLTVPQVKSIACSTEKAMEWDETFKKNADESGRAVLGVHTTSGTEKQIKKY